MKKKRAGGRRVSADAGSALARENRELRGRLAEAEARLAEAEETLRAIRGGEVDALVVAGLEEERFRLHEAEAPYRSLVEEMNEGALLLSPEGTVLYANARFAQWACVALEQTIGSSWERLFVPAERAQLKQLLEAARSACLREELHLQAGGGTSRPVGLSLCPIHEGVKGFSVVVTDLTERKAAEAALRAANERLESRVQERTLELRELNERLEYRVQERTTELAKAGEKAQAERQRFYEVLNMLPAYVVLLSADYHVPFANRFFEDRFGKSEGKRCFEYLFNRTEPCENCETYKVLKTNAPHHWEWTGPDGRNYEIHDFPFTDADGSRMILEMGIDITERKQAERELRAERQRFYEVLEALPPMVCLLTPDYHVAFANRAFRERFGESQGRHCYEHCFGRSEPCEFCESYTVLKTGKPHHWEVNAADGSVIDAYDFPFTDADGSAMILEMDMDITASRRAEEALRRANAYNRSLLEASLDPLVTIGPDGKITDVNLATETAVGAARSALVGTDFSDYFSEPEKARAGYQQVFREGFVRDYPLELRHRDGRLMPVLYNASVYRDDSRKVIGVFAAARDISERKRAEAALKEANERLEQRVAERTAELRESEQRFRLVLRHAPVSVAAQNRDLRYIWAYNQKTAPPEGVIGRLDSEIFTPEEAARIIAQKRRVLEENIGLRAQMWLERPSGRMFLDVSWEPLHDESGQVIGVGSATVDLTPIKLAEEALRQSEEQFRTLADSIPNLAWWANGDGYITWYNRRWYEYTGTTPEQMEGWGWQSVHDPEVLPKVLERWKGSIATGEPFEMEFPLRGTDGQFRLFLTRVLPLKDAQGRVLRWFGTNTDVDELKRAEEGLKLSLRDKEVMLKEIHHRVKNNLQVIASLVDLQADALKDPALLQVFPDIRDRVRSMALVHEKLYQSESLARVDFADYARSLLNYLGRSYRNPETAIELKTDLGAVSLSVETAVPCGLILNELVSNAFKHAFRGPAGGEVTVALGRGADGWMYLRVRDNGVGLPAGLKWRESRSLGLRLIHLLAGQLGAEVEVRSDGGTEFELTFETEREAKYG